MHLDSDSDVICPQPVDLNRLMVTKSGYFLENLISSRHDGDDGSENVSASLLNSDSCDAAGSGLPVLLAPVHPKGCFKAWPTSSEHSV